MNEDFHHFGELFSLKSAASKQKRAATSQMPSLRPSAARKTLTPGGIHLQSWSPLTMLNIPHKHKALFSHIVPPPPASLLVQKCWYGRKSLWRSTVAVVGLRATLNSDQNLRTDSPTVRRVHILPVIITLNSAALHFGPGTFVFLKWNVLVHYMAALRHTLDWFTLGGTGDFV